MALPMKRAPSMKEMKKNSVRKIARGVMAKALVFGGRRQKTSGGLTKDKLMKNKRGKIVSKSRSALAQRRYSTSILRTWNDLLKAARRELSIVDFVAINGKTAQGKALYAHIKAQLAIRAYELHMKAQGAPVRVLSEFCRKVTDMKRPEEDTLPRDYAKLL